MREYIEIGSTPADEDCAQVGSEDYTRRMRRESAAYIGQLRRMFGPEPDGARLAVKGFPHDFGTYHEVVCYYDPEKPDSVDYAFKCEGEGPDKWDAVAVKELADILFRLGDE